MRILVIAPHMDDEVLGCGGTIVKHFYNKDVVYVCFIAHRKYSHRFNLKKNESEKRDALDAKRKLFYKECVFFDLEDEVLDGSVQEIIIPLERYVSKVKPEIVYIPFHGDNNQDHRAVFNAARVVLRPVATSFVKNIYLYEIPSSTEQSPPLVENMFLPSRYVDITKYIRAKINAFQSYKTEQRVYPHPRSLKALEVLAQKRGTEVGFKYAEAFMVLREKWE